jgi:hypothetical protein
MRNARVNRPASQATTCERNQPKAAIRGIVPEGPPRVNAGTRDRDAAAARRRRGVKALALARRNHSVRPNPEAVSNAEGLGFGRGAKSLQIWALGRVASRIFETVA